MVKEDKLLKKFLKIEVIEAIFKKISYRRKFRKKLKKKIIRRYSRIPRLRKNWYSGRPLSIYKWEQVKSALTQLKQCRTSITDKNTLWCRDDLSDIGKKPRWTQVYEASIQILHMRHYL